jgi:excisionase family DNA binding protein
LSRDEGASRFQWMMPNPARERTTMPMRTDRLPNLLDIDGVAEHLGVNERHVRQLVAERRIPFVKWGHLLRFDPAEIAAWLDRQRVAVGGRRRS